MPPSLHDTTTLTMTLDNLEKVGWVLLKSGYNITPYGELKNKLYHLNNDSVQFKEMVWN